MATLLPAKKIGPFQTDMLLAVMVLSIVGVMIVPLPAGMLDILLTINLSFSLVVLVNALYVKGPLELSTFPTIMLIATLLRLALNVASTRLILGDAYAGDMISSFGSFVVKDNYVVGFVVFLILVAIQFFVIVKGTERNAEVGARFTLDAMPGKQMSIDADLNAGLINEEEAKARREDLSREASFFGAMDGAAKFVKGDAIAGILITLVNILAGMVVGVLQLGLAPMEAVQTYTKLTIGDGLMSQLPALALSVAAGIVVSRAAEKTSLGENLQRQLFEEKKPMAIVAAALVVLAMLPGLPAIPLLTVAALLALSLRKGKALPVDPDAEGEGAGANADDEPSLQDSMRVDRLELALGFGLIPLVEHKDRDFLDRVAGMRRKIAQEVGIFLPKIRVRDDVGLEPSGYEYRLRGHRIGKGEVFPGQLLCIGPPDKLAKLEGVDTREPAFGLPAKWVANPLRGDAERAGLTVVDSIVVIITHLTELMRKHAHEIIDRQDVQDLIDRLAEDSPALVKTNIPDKVALGTVHRVLEALLRESVPIVDLGSIVEVIVDQSEQVKDPDLLTEYVRARLTRTITESATSSGNVLAAISLDPRLETMLVKQVRESGLQLAGNVTPNVLDAVYTGIEHILSAVKERGLSPVVLCSPQIRLAFRRMIEPHYPNLLVLSYHEVIEDADVQSVGVLTLEGPRKQSASNHDQSDQPISV